MKKIERAKGLFLERQARGFSGVISPVDIPVSFELNPEAIASKTLGEKAWWQRLASNKLQAALFRITTGVTLRSVNVSLQQQVNGLSLLISDYQRVSPENQNAASSAIKAAETTDERYSVKAERGVYGSFNPGLEEVVRRYLPQNKRGRMLDIGCFEGDLLNSLRGFVGEGIGIDVSRASIENRKGVFQENLVGKQLDVLATNVQELGGQFDVVVSNFVFDTVPDQKSFVNKLTEFTREGGYVVLGTAAPFRQTTRDGKPIVPDPSNRIGTGLNPVTDWIALVNAMRGKSFYPVIAEMTTFYGRDAQVVDQWPNLIMVFKKLTGERRGR